MKKDFWGIVSDILILEGRYTLAHRVLALSETSQLSQLERQYQLRMLANAKTRRRIFAAIEKVAQKAYTHLVELFHILMGCEWTENVALATATVEGLKMIASNSVLQAERLERYYHQ